MKQNTSLAASLAALSIVGIGASFPHLASAADPIAVLAPQTSVNAPIALSTDGVHYATVAADNTITVRDRVMPLTAPATATLTGHKAHILALAFSRDGKFLATADDDRIIDIWNLAEGKSVRSIHEPKVTKETEAKATSNVTSLAFNPLGTELVIVDMGYGTMGRYQGDMPDKLSYLDAYYTSAPLASVASDGQMGWVAGDTGGAFHFYNAALKEIGTTPSKMASSVLALAVSPDGKYLATGGDDNEVKIWNFGGAAAASTAANFTLSERYSTASAVTSLAFRGDWKTILFVDSKRQLNEWTYVAAPAPAAVTPPPTQVAAVLPTPAPPTATVTTPVVPVTVAPTPPPVKPEAPIVIAAGQPKTGKTVVASRDVVRTGTAAASSLPPPKHTQLFVKQTSRLVGHSDYVNDVAFSPDGKTLASGSRDQTVRLWNVAEGTQETILGKHASYVSAVAFSPDGRTLASGGWDDKIKLFDVASQSEDGADQKLAKSGSYVLSLDFSPDGSHLASGSNDRIARLFNTTTGADRASSALPDGVSSIAFSPDGTRVAGGCLDGTVYVWDTATMHRLQAYKPATGARPIFCIAFLDKDTIAAGGKGGSLNVWNAHTGLLAVLPAGGQDIFGLAFDGPRQILAAGGADKQIRFWPADAIRKVKNGAHLAPTLTLAGHKNTVRTLAFSNDGTLLASGGWDYNILLWSITEKNSLTGLSANAPEIVASR